MYGIYDPEQRAWAYALGWTTDKSLAKTFDARRDAEDWIELHGVPDVAVRELGE